MTSNRLSSDLSLLGSAIKRQIHILALYAIVFFFAIPVGIALVINNSEPMSIGSDITGYFAALFGMLAVCVVIASFISAMSVCAYMHSKTQVDFYHSLPVSRQRLFTYNYLCGLLLPVIPYFVMLLLGAAILLGSGNMGYVDFGFVMPNIGLSILYYTLIYSCVMLCGTLCGNVVLQLLTGALLMTFAPIIIRCWQTYMEIFYRTFYASSELFTRLYAYSSPVWRYFYAVGNGYFTGVRLGAVTAPGFAETVITVLLCVALYFISVAVYRIRPSESAGKAIAFGPVKPVVKYIVVTCAALTMGIAFYYMGNSSLGWLVFGLICGGVLSHMITEIVYAFDFKCIFKNLSGLAIYMVLLFAVICVPVFDLTGFDSYTPSVDDIKSVNMSITSSDSYARSNLQRWNNTFSTFGSSYENSISALLMNTELTDAQCITAAAELARFNAEGLHAEKYDNVPPDYGRYKECVVRYNMKNGLSHTRRLYYLNDERCDGLVDLIRRSPEYIMGHHVIFDVGDDLLGRSSLFGCSSSTALEPAFSAEQTRALAEALRYDMTGNTPEADEMPVYVLHFTSQKMIDRYSDAPYMANIEQELRELYGYYELEYPVYPSYSRTLGVLSSFGVDTSDPYDIKNIDRIDIVMSYNRDIHAYDDYGRSIGLIADFPESYVNGVTVTDPDVIKVVLENSLPDYMDSSFFRDTMSKHVYFFAEAYYKNGAAAPGDSEADDSDYPSVSLSLYADNLPDDIKALIDYDAVMSAWKDAENFWEEQ